MKQKYKKAIVFFNASVVIAGLRSTTGGSAKLLEWVKSNKIIGIISELVFNEILKHTSITNLSREQIKEKIGNYFILIKAPDKRVVESYTDIVIDKGDRHILASAEEARCTYLVTLDKKHLLVLKNKIKKFKIVNPKELIIILEKGEQETK